MELTKDEKDTVEKLEKTSMDINRVLPHYPTVAERMKSYSSPERVKEVESHIEKLKLERIHIPFKKESKKCLSCPKVLLCQTKCEEV